MTDPHPTYAPDDPAAVECYCTALRALAGAGVEVLVGGAYALAPAGWVVRDTKDLDLFLRRADRDRALAALTAAGYQAGVTYPHWLAKAARGDYFIDLIYNSGNGVAPVDDVWFRHATPGVVCGVPVRLCPPEEAVWQKAFIMERNRFDGADINHVLRAAGDRLDWRRLLDRFGPHWRVLLGHVVLFGYVFPSDRDRVPAWVTDELLARLRDEPPTEDRVCRGTLLAAMQYLPDVTEGGYADARLPPHGAMTPDDVAVWTDGVRSGR